MCINVQAEIRMVPNTVPPVSDSPYQKSASHIIISPTYFIIFSGIPNPADAGSSTGHPSILAFIAFTDLQMDVPLFVRVGK
jgi:hypothetical protein